MKRNSAFVFVALIALMMAGACSMNRQLPASMDEEALEVEIRAAITAVAPGKTMEVDVTENGHVTLSGHADNAAQRDAIVSRVRGVNGVRSVDASNIHLQ